MNPPLTYDPMTDNITTKTYKPAKHLTTEELGMEIIKATTLCIMGNYLYSNLNHFNTEQRKKRLIDEFEIRFKDGIDDDELDAFNAGLNKGRKFVENIVNSIN